MKTSTKQVKKVLHELPQVKAPPGFVKRLQNKISEQPRPRWDDVEFEWDVEEQTIGETTRSAFKEIREWIIRLIKIGR